MSLIEFIQKLQNKPRNVRIQILYLSVFVSMIIVISLWAFLLKYSLSNNVEKVEEKKSDELVQSLNDAREQLPSLINIFKESMGSFFEEDLEIIGDEDIELEEVIEQVEPIEELKEGVVSSRLPLSKNIND